MAANPSETVESLRLHKEELWFQAQQLLEAQADFESVNQNLRQWFDHAPVGYLMLDRTGSVSEMNATAASWLGMRTEPRRQFPFVIAVAAADRQRFLDHMRLCREPHQSRVVTELTLQSRSGEQRPVHLISRIFASDVPEAVFPSVAVDVTELRQAQDIASKSQEQMERSSRLASIGTLAAGVAHEINNPLNTIRMLAEYALLEGSRTDPRETLGEIITQTQRCSAIVRGILRFSRDEGLPLEWGDINEVVRRSIRLTQSIVAPEHLKLELQLASDLAPIQMNTMGLEQVMVNLLKNAVEATGGPVMVRIKTERTPGGLRMTVQDNGPGISEPNLSRIFDPFYSTHQWRGGTGLGLSICHRIISDHGGSISVTSTAGQGATFTIDLPAGTPSAP